MSLFRKCLPLFILVPAVALAQTAPSSFFGYKDFSAQAKVDSEFMGVPSAKVAGEDLKTLTAAPHIAGSKEDYATAQFVAAKFMAAGLETEIVPYVAWMNLPVS